MVNGAYYDRETDSIVVDGLIDTKNDIRYLGRAKRDEYGRWCCLAIVGGVGLCKVQLNVEPVIDSNDELRPS